MILAQFSMEGKKIHYYWSVFIGLRISLDWFNEYKRKIVNTIVWIDGKRDGIKKFCKCIRFYRIYLCSIKALFSPFLSFIFIIYCNWIIVKSIYKSDSIFTSVPVIVSAIYSLLMSTNLSISPSDGLLTFHDMREQKIKWSIFPTLLIMNFRQLFIISIVTATKLAWRKITAKQF